ncbi:ECF RNA polymerase sigma factor SigE [Rubripirellula obstinata]|uniref:ECF RNA polymerase sigma factor SigE n=1 Tax=Rubripirellula obstinata TaxID=406547 RepID=A0A5B1CMJ0_9BACT|nr:sigma-70 family RNA polymerase sigma factor [Rubripirellula obstinata]KAA1260563.1 ECF RNA polymerase sigma factor SigE [Rubripirellula obstinata]
MSNSSELPASQMSVSRMPVRNVSVRNVSVGNVSVGNWGSANNMAMSALVQQHHSLVFKICMKFLGHRQDAEDVTQETFSRFAKHFDRWDRGRPLEPWLAKIAGNRCRSFLASRQSVRHRSALHQSLSEVSEPVRQETQQIDAANQLQEEVSIAIAALPQMQQTAFTMFHEQGLSYAEISDRVGHPLGTVKTWVHRARQQLIQHLSHRDAIVPQRKQSGGA